MRLGLILFFLVNVATAFCGEFRVRPYVQNPSSSAITIRWFSTSNDMGTVKVTDGTGEQTFQVPCEPADALAFNPFKEEPGGPHPSIPFRHTVTVEGLKPAQKYSFTVTQGQESAVGTFRTAPAPSSQKSVRLIVYSDSETEPESSTSGPVAWPVGPNSNRPEGVANYVADQTVGYQENCRVMLERSPHLLLVVGDLVESGGEQRDWDEFWQHNAGDRGQIASHVPILPALGNHENYGGPGGGYSAEAADFAVDKYLTYFALPDNHASDPHHGGRYYRLDYGPVTILTLDSSDGLPHQTASDTNHNLSGSRAPDFNPGSEQYRWLETQLLDVQKNQRIVFVQFHHTMFGSGPHSIPFGHANFSGQSGIAMRVLLPVFMKYGVDAVFSGHDEMLERSEVSGMRQNPDGSNVPHTIHFYDVGIGGDGLRGPSEDFDNPHRCFLAHDDAKEVWENGQLVSGGKHYGHLEVNLVPDESKTWTISIDPVHVFPVTNSEGHITAWERRIYADSVKWTKRGPK
jgi:hypothetical protein